MSGSLTRISIGDNGSWGNELLAITSLLPLQVDLVGGGATSGNDTYNGDSVLIAEVTLLPTPAVNLDLDASEQDNTADGLGGNDTLNGGGGNDRLYGNVGNDVVNGDDGNDVLSGGAGKDTLSGGEGNDTFVFASVGDSTKATVDVITDWEMGDRIDLSSLDADGATPGRQSLTFTGLVNFAEGASVGAGEVTFHQYRGNTFINVALDDNGREMLIQLNGLHTLSVADFIGVVGNAATYGDATNNTLTGDVGNDSLYGMGGNDRLFGGAGDDVLVGGAGKDTMTGGAGNDIFTYSEMTDSSASLRDVITDWASGDLIDLSAIDADKTIAGHQDFSFGGLVSSADAGAVGAGEITYHHYAGNTFVNVAFDGDGRDMLIEVRGVHTLEASDFIGIG